MLVVLFSGVGALGEVEILHNPLNFLFWLSGFDIGFLLLIVTDIPGINFWGLFMAAAGCYVSQHPSGDLEVTADTASQPLIVGSAWFNDVM